MWWSLNHFRAMSFWSYLENLRQEPEEKRRLILWWATSVITLLIITGWLLSWNLAYPPEIPLESSVATSTVATSTEMIAPSAWENFKIRMIKGWQTLTKTK